MNEDLKGTTIKKGKGKGSMTPYKRAVMLAVLAYVAALPTGYYGYKVVNVGFGEPVAIVAFDDRYHEIIKVDDGDTVVFDNGEVIRLIGIDAPEEGQCYSEEAEQALIGLVADREVYVLKDENPTDRYGRLLRYLFVKQGDKDRGDFNVNKELVRLGYAVQVQVSPNIQYQAALRSAQTEAKKFNRGIWKECDTELLEEEALEALPTDENCTIKGNIGADEVKRYSTENCRSYSQIKINTRTEEQYFCTEEEAVTAGFEKNGDCF